MKRLLLILIYLTSTVYASAWNEDPHLKKLVDCINDSDFVCAEQQLPLVKDWSPLQTCLTTFRALAFLKQAETIIIEKQYLDSFRLYIADESDSYRRRYTKRGEYEKALAYGKLAARLYAKVLGKKHPQYAISLSKLGGLYDNLENYNLARKFYIESLKIAEDFSDEHIDEYETILNNIGTFYLNIGNYIQAEQYYLRILLLRNKSLEEIQPTDAILLSNMGMLYKELGEHAKAEKYCLKALELDSIKKGTRSLDYASSLSNLGSIYEEMNNYSKAELYRKRALEIRATILSESHPDYVQSLMNLGILYCKMKRYLDAEKFCKQALEIRSLKKEERPLEYASSLHTLGYLYYKMREYNQAEYYYLEALKIREIKLSRTNLNYIITINNLGVLYYEMEKYEAAEPYYISCSELYKEHYLNTLTFLSEKQRAAYLETIKDIYDLKFPRLVYHYYPKNPYSSIPVYDNELFLKGALLQSIDIIKRSVIESGDTTLIPIWNELINLKDTISILQERASDAKKLSEYINLAEMVEKAIILASAAYRENQRQWTITWDSVRAELKPNQVAIEYMTAPLNEDSTMYCALLLRDTCSYPIMIPLFEEKEVTSLLHTSTGDTANINTTYMYGRNGSQLSNLIWSKVQPYLNQREVVFISPTGLLHQVAFENLPYDSTRTMTDVYNIVRLSSTRELAMHKDSIAHTAATLYGGIKYHVSTDVMYANNQRYRDIDREGIKDLPGTKQEVEAIAPILRDHNIEVHVFSADTANEESFKALSGKKQNILHIGTHGFYWTDSTAQSAAYFKQRTLSIGNDQYAPKTIDPLNRCGLLFAGASTAISGDAHRLQDGVQDGVLTAKEISLMDLRDADIVVLSACETGLGDVTGDGVFGLQRAFKMAGARTILMSLWKVDDDATRMLMTSFYRYYVNGMSKRAAFRKAQQEVRNYTGTVEEIESTDRAAAQERFKNKGKLSSQTEPVQQMKEGTLKYPYQSPYYWAGFILLD